MVPLWKTDLFSAVFFTFGARLWKTCILQEYLADKSVFCNKKSAENNLFDACVFLLEQADMNAARIHALLGFLKA